MFKSSVDKFYKGYIFDLDGTIYYGSKLLPGARELIPYLRARGSRVLFLSNNPSHTRRSYAEKLTRMGIETMPKEVMSSGDILAKYLRENHPRCRVYVLGETALLDTLRESGLEVLLQPSADEKVDFVVASMDLSFDFAKLSLGMRLLMNGSELIATHGDPACPWDGGFVPDAGAIAAALSVSARKPVALVAGKPTALACAMALDELGCTPAEVLVVGDRMGTDIQLGADHGMDTALVLTGGDSLEDLVNYSFRPTYILENLWAVLPNEEARRQAQGIGDLINA